MECVRSCTLFEHLPLLRGCRVQQVQAGTLDHLHVFIRQVRPVQVSTCISRVCTVWHVLCVAFMSNNAKQTVEHLHIYHASLYPAGPGKLASLQ